MVCSLITKSCYRFQFVNAEFEDLCFFLSLGYSVTSYTFRLTLLCFTAWLLVGTTKSGIWMTKWNRNAYDHYIFIRTICLHQILRFFFTCWSHSPGVLDLVYGLQLFHGYISSFNHSMLVHHLFICGTVEIMKKTISLIIANKQWKKRNKKKRKNWRKKTQIDMMVVPHNDRILYEMVLWFVDLFSL